MTIKYDKPILDEIQRTNNDKEGIKKIIDMALGAIDNLDEELEELSTQRTTLMGIISNFNKIYEVLQGTELLTKRRIRDLESHPERLQSMEDFRQFTLDGANNISSRPGNDGNVSVEELERALGVMGQIPWKNPRNAIDTILKRSGEWEKIEPGIWSKKKIEEE